MSAEQAGKIRAIRNEYLKTGSVPSQIQAAAMMLYITALIAEHCNLDQIAVENEGGSNDGAWLTAQSSRPSCKRSIA